MRKTKNGKSIVNVFIIDGDYVGKSILIQKKKMACIFRKNFQCFLGSQDNVKAPLPTPTGVAAVNTSGTRTKFGWSIPISFFKPFLWISHQNKRKSQNLYIEVEVTIIDKISMISNQTLQEIHKWFFEIVGYN